MSMTALFCDCIHCDITECFLPGLPKYKAACVYLLEPVVARPSCTIFFGVVGGATETAKTNISNVEVGLYCLDSFIKDREGAPCMY